jgi:hypothetical protein
VPESAIAMLSLFVDGHDGDAPYVDFHVWDGEGEQHTFKVYDDTLVLLYVEKEGMREGLYRPRDLYHQVMRGAGAGRAGSRTGESSRRRRYAGCLEGGAARREDGLY